MSGLLRRAEKMEDSKMAKREITKEQAGKEIAADSKKMTEAKVTKTKIKLLPPPPPPVKIGDVVNPILEKKGLKRALTVAIVHVCTNSQGVLNENKAAAMIRTAGIIFKQGWKPDAHTDPLVQNEWSGKPYVRFVTNTQEGKVYAEKHPERVEACKAFAKALKSTVDEQLAKEKAAAPVAAEVTK